METMAEDRLPWKIKEKKGDFILSADFQQEQLNLEHPNGQKRPVLKQIYRSQRALNAFLLLQLPSHPCEALQNLNSDLQFRFTIKFTPIITADEGDNEANKIELWLTDDE